VLQKKVYVLKQSPDADKVTVFQNVSFKTLNGQWIAQVGYAGVSLPPWLGGVIVAALLISILLSWMLMLIFFEKLAHQDLLKEMLPRKALKKIQRGETVVEKYSMVTVFFCDIVGYTSISADMRPIQVMKLLNTYYNEVDKLASKHKVFKIETIGDSYMCVGGCPERCLGSEAAEHVALFALELVELVKNFSTEDGMQIVIRAGMNSGPVVAGVVGTNVCIHGDLFYLFFCMTC
jgi:class 3 adenylate cyclase